MNLKNVIFLRRFTSTIVAGEALLLFFLALFLIVESFISEAKNFDALIAEIVFAILGGLGLLLLLEELDVVSDMETLPRFWQISLR